MREYTKGCEPFSFNASMSRAMSEPGGNLPRPSLEPGKPPSDWRDSETFFGILGVVVTIEGTFGAAAARADLRPSKGWGWLFDKIDWARLSMVSGSGVSSPSSMAAFEGWSSPSISIFQSVSYSMTVAAAFVMRSRPQVSILSASVW